MAAASLLFAIPALNEASTIGHVVQQLKNYGRVLVIDDGSHDNTARIAEEAGATVHRHASNLGYDRAIVTSILLAMQFSCDWLLTVDADGQHQIADLEKFRPHFNDADLIIGCRPPASMRVGERLVSLYYRKLFGIHDPMSGFKGYRCGMLSQITLPRSSPNPSYGLDVLDAVLRANAKVIEVSISINNRQDAARIGNTWEVNKRLLLNLYKRFHHELR